MFFNIKLEKGLSKFIGTNPYKTSASGASSPAAGSWKA